MTPLETRIAALIREDLGGGGGCVEGPDWDWDDKEFEKIVAPLARKIAQSMGDVVEGLREASAVAKVCRDAVDAQTNSYLNGVRPSWKSAAQTCFNEIADKPEGWDALVVAADA